MPGSAQKRKRARTRRGQLGVTLHQVAAKAGVSPMTVSRVVAGFPNIREDTRQRVSDAIREMGYSPNTAARHLAAGPIRIGLLHGNPSETYTGQLLISFLTNSVRSGWQPVMEHCTSPRACELALDRLLKSGVDAVI